MDEASLLEVLRLLHIAPHKRSQKDVESIMQRTSSIKFFAEQDPAVHLACCQLMKFAEFPEEKYIFQVGDPGDSFCIILKGRVSVQIPSHKLGTESTRQVFKSEKETRTPTLSTNRRIFLYTKQLLGFSIMKKADAIEVDSFVRKVPSSEHLVAVAEMHAGSYFGELALLQGLPRSASIQCLQHTMLGVLSKESFNLVLKEHEARKLNWKINFLLSIPIFSSWSRQAVSRLTYYLKERNYRRKDRVFEEGATASEAFIVVQGEFKLTKTCRVNREITKSLHTQSLYTQLQVVIKGPKEMFGELDLLSDQKRSMNCTCVSTTGLLWVISKFDFTQRIQSPETWNYIYRRGERQMVWISDRLDSLLSVEEQKLSPWERLNGRELPEVVRSTATSPELKHSLQRFSNCTMSGVHLRTASLTGLKSPKQRHRPRGRLQSPSMWSRAYADLMGAVGIRARTGSQ